MFPYLIFPTIQVEVSTLGRKIENRGKGKSIQLFCSWELKTGALSFSFEFRVFSAILDVFLDCEVTSFLLHRMLRDLYYFSH